MESQETIVITISRQLGSGGSHLAQRLADRLCFKYLDREILRRAAAQMGEEARAIEHLDEHPCSFWDSLLESFVPGTLESYLPPPIHYPDHREVLGAETLIIREVARTQNAVILGRGGFHTLAGHPGNIGIFLHALYQIRNEKEALAMIEQTDYGTILLAQSFIGRNARTRPVVGRRSPQVVRRDVPR